MTVFILISYVRAICYIWMSGCSQGGYIHGADINDGIGVEVSGGFICGMKSPSTIADRILPREARRMLTKIPQTSFGRSLYLCFFS